MIKIKLKITKIKLKFSDLKAKKDNEYQFESKKIKLNKNIFLSFTFNIFKNL